MDTDTGQARNLRHRLGRWLDRLNGAQATERAATRLEAMSAKLDTQAAHLAAMQARLETIEATLVWTQQAVQGAAQDALAAAIGSAGDPRTLTAAPGQVYSQNTEDGIVAEIFRRIGTQARTFVEIGVGGGVENTTRLLLDLGWKGLWCEGDPHALDAVRTHMATALESGDLELVEGYVTADTVARTLAAYRGEGRLDYLSIDIDYNTSHVWAALEALRPRAACIEYNAHFPPSVAYEVPYDPDGRWDGTTRFGASLKRLEQIGAGMGYRLVGCDLLGVNAFFVRADLCDERTFLSPFTAETHYQPPRYALTHMRGHGRQARFSR